MLLARMPSGEDRHLVELVRLAGAQALAIADDLVAEAGLGADRFRVVPAPFDPAATLRAVAELWGPQFAGQGVQLRVDIGDGVPASVVGDESRVRQILFNLVSNAAKATAAGTVTLALGPIADGVVFSAADEGPGLADGFQAEPFARSDQPRPGTGLGLWISGRIAEALAGDLTLQNAAGGGAVARLAIPAVFPLASTPAPPRRSRRSTAAAAAPEAMPSKRKSRAGRARPRRQHRSSSPIFRASGRWWWTTARSRGC